MKNTFKAMLALTTALTGLSVTAPQAVAQTEGEGAREIVTVTARRREETIIDTPVAVSAVSGDVLEDIGAVDITSLTRLTPNATIEAARGSNSTLIAFIRGVGQQDPLWGFEPGVGVYVDDVFFARPQGAVLDIFDVERIEVLRGPQGTLYGRNTVGGAIKYVTKDLNMDELELSARINVGSYQQFDQIIRASAPITDTFAIGVGLARYTRDGFGENLFTGAEHYDKDVLATRLSAEWRPTDTFSVKFAADRTDDDSSPKHGHRLLPSFDGTLPVTSNVFDTRAGIGDSNEVISQGLSLTAEWDLNDVFTLRSITAYREGDTITPIDFDALPQPDFDVPATYQDDQLSQELQVLFDSGRISGVAGLYYLDSTASGDFDVILSSLGLTIYQAGLQEKENLAAYADVTFDLNDQWSLSLGGRFTQDDTTADVTREVWLGLGSGSFDSSSSSVFLATQTGYQGISRSDEQFTPRVSLSYEPTDTMTVYASYSQGFKAGGFDPRARADLDPLGISQQGFGPETVDSYELGLKGLFFDGRLSLNSAVFLADYQDQQITVQQGVDTDNNGVNDTFVSSVFNAGASEYQGLELEAALFVNDALTLTGMVGYIDAEITEIISAGVNIADAFVTQNTPELSGRLGFNYVHDFATGGDVTFNGSASYRDEYFLFNVPNQGFAPGTSAFFPQGGPALDPDAYTLIDLSAVYTSENDRWRFGLYGRNLTDEEYRVAAYNFVTPSQLGLDSAYSAFYGAPQTFMASFEVRY